VDDQNFHGGYGGRWPRSAEEARDHTSIDRRRKPSLLSSR
jgi:hypothetical protein